MLAKETNRAHDRIVVEIVELHQAEHAVGTDLGVALELVDAGLGVSEDHHVVLIDIIKGPIPPSRLLNKGTERHRSVRITGVTIAKLLERLLHAVGIEP